MAVKWLILIFNPKIILEKLRRVFFFLVSPFELLIADLIYVCLKTCLILTLQNTADNYE